LHRDLKPQNVLLTKSDGEISHRVFLADFGMAGKLEHSEDFKSSVVGTPSFMSPEMLQGRPYGCKTDQWALGCVLWEMMALSAPFANCDSYAGVVVAILQSPPLQAPVGYSCELSIVVERLLAKQPHDRPSNAEMLSGGLLRPTFQMLIRCIADGVSDKSPSAHARDEHYDSDFESYSSSEDASRTGELTDYGEKTENLLAELPGSVGVYSWTQLLTEAEGLLDGGSESPGPDRIMKLRHTLRSLLGSEDQVDTGISFMRERKPLGDTAEADEMVLHIEIGDVLGENGLHALPLLERYLALEQQSHDV